MTQRNNRDTSSVAVPKVVIDRLRTRFADNKSSNVEIVNTALAALLSDSELASMQGVFSFNSQRVDLLRQDVARNTLTQAQTLQADQNTQIINALSVIASQMKNLYDNVDNQLSTLRTMNKSQEQTLIASNVLSAWLVDNFDLLNPLDTDQARDLLNALDSPQVSNTQRLALQSAKKQINEKLSN